ncbi:MAG TPA: methyltransferase domain-containing protein [Acidimicrobiales bacterium]|nr:methyltransferase domain-containing protein [Acidimicrobiales bacterium]
MSPEAGPGDWDAATYDRIADPMTRWGETVLERLHPGPGATVLDAGCGTGRVTEMLLERDGDSRVVALDAAPSMLVEARRRLARFGDRVTFLRADLLELSAPLLGEAAPVDAVLSTATFHWVLDHDRLFSNLAAVLRGGGRLEAQCGAEGNIAGLMAAVRATGHERTGAWYYATVAETEARLARFGFTNIEVWTHPEPTRLDPDELETYLETVCLRTLVAPMDAAERHRFLTAVAAALGEPVIDYVRLNIVARRA